MLHNGGTAELPQMSFGWVRGGSKRRRGGYRHRVGMPVMAPNVVDNYLTRGLDSYDFMKQVPTPDLAAEARERGFRYVTRPRAAQLVGNLIGEQEAAYLFFLDMGGGKSKLVLDLIRLRRARRELRRALILVPELIHLYSWEDQLKEHAPDLRCVTLVGAREERFDLLKSPADVCLMNYKGLEVYMSRRAGRKQRVDAAAAEAFASGFNFVVFDEIHHVGNHQSLVYRLCSWLAATCTYRYGLTGTPFGRDPMKLWPQFQIVDRGETFGALGVFRAAFFTAKQNYWGGVDYTFRHDREAALHQMLKHRSVRYDECELSDLPPVSYVRVPVRLTEEGQLYYARVVRRMVEAKGDYRSLESSFIRMRQCASGFLSLKADDESRVEIELDPNPKLEALRAFLEDLPAAEKVLIFHDFTYSGNRIRALLTEMKLGWATLYGGVRDTEAQYQRFLQDPKCRAFVLQSQTGSEAINPQHVCRYAVFYECPLDPTRRHQAVKRVSRPGQTRHTFIYDLVVTGTVEEKLLEYAREGRDLLRAVLNGETSI